MAKYVDRNLLDAEVVVYKGKLHWIEFLPGLIFILFGVLLSGSTDSNPDVHNPDQTISGNVLGILVILFGLVMLFSAFIRRISTELALTSSRVIVKTGFIKRNTTELIHSKVESLNVNQSIMGRMLGFGTIIINGTGGIQTPIRYVSKPLEFRKQAMSTVFNQAS